MLTFILRNPFFFFFKNNEISKDELYSFFNAELKRETPEELMFRRPLRKFVGTKEKKLNLGI